MKQLKPCPVCNGEVEFTEDFYGEGLFTAVYCPNSKCGIALIEAPSAYFRDPATLIASWNNLLRKEDKK